MVTTADKGGKGVLLDLNQYSEMWIMHLEDQACEKVREFGVGRGKVNLEDEDLFNEDFVRSDPSNHLLRQQCN